MHLKFIAIFVLEVSKPPPYCDGLRITEPVQCVGGCRASLRLHPIEGRGSKVLVAANKAVRWVFRVQSH